MYSVGIGCTYYINKNFGIRNEVFYRIYNFNKAVLEHGGDKSLNEEVSAGSFNLSFSIFYTLFGFKYH
jgi:hypothetical protein